MVFCIKSAKFSKTITKLPRPLLTAVAIYMPEISITPCISLRTGGRNHQACIRQNAYIRRILRNTSNDVNRHNSDCNCNSNCSYSELIFFLSVPIGMHDKSEVRLCELAVTRLEHRPSIGRDSVSRHGYILKHPLTDNRSLGVKS